MKYVSLLFVALVGLSGCTGPSQPTTDYVLTSRAQNNIERAGYAASVACLNYKKVSVEDAVLLEQVADILSVTAKGYQKGGFAGLLPEVNKQLALRLPGDDKKAIRLLGAQLAAAWFEALDAKFADQPKWQTDATTAATLLARFFKGVRNGIHDYAND